MPSLPPLQPLVKLSRTGVPLPGAPKLPVLPVWTSLGVVDKPEACNLCPFKAKGTGFVPDWYPNAEGDVQLGLLLSTPVSDDVVEGRPWAGRGGFALERKFLAPFGLALKDVFVGHVLRCQPRDRHFGKPQYPTAKLRRDAELTCRQHDDRSFGGPVLRTEGLKTWNPDYFVITFHPSETILVPALSVLLLRDMEKAVKKARAGHRVMVLMGKEAKELVAPWLDGPIKSWRGHHWAGVYPFVQNSSLLEGGWGPGFSEG
jgi:hypothetical protein